jgi:outer membrane lipoprotein-sorting protein
MKKISLFFIILFAMLLAACGTEETLDKSEVLKRSSEAVESLNSYSIDALCILKGDMISPI